MVAKETFLPEQPGFTHEIRDWMPAYAITIQVVTTVLLAIRLISRFNRTGGRLGLDDVLITAAWIFGLTMTIVIIMCTTTNGFDKHLWDVPMELWSRGALLAWVVQVTFLLSTCCTKTSVLLFYRRLVSGTYSTKFKWAVWIAILFVLAYTITFVVLLCVTCFPLEGYWLQYDLLNVHYFHCASARRQVALSRLSGAVSVITDFYSVMLPAFLVFQIKINRRQRWGLMFIFGMGFLVVAAGVVRTVYLANVQAAVLDKSWTSFNVFVASIFECNIAIVCACAPSLKTVTGRFFRDLTSKVSSKESSKQNSKRNGKENSEQSEQAEEVHMKEFERYTDSKLDVLGGRKGSVNRVAAVASGIVRKASLNCKQNIDPSLHSEHMEQSSFVDAHENGLDSLAPVVEGYDDEPLTRLESPSPPSPASIEGTPTRGPPPNLRAAHAALAQFSRSTSSRPSESGIPTATIAIRPSSTSPMPATSLVTASEHLRPLKKSTSQPFHHPQSPAKSNSPSFIFLSDEHEGDQLVKLKYRSFVESSSDEDEEPRDAIAAQSSSHVRSQSLKEDLNAKQEYLRRINVPHHTRMYSDGMRSPPLQRSGQPGSVREAILRAQQMQAQGLALGSTPPPFRNTNRNSTSHISSASEPSSEEGVNDGLSEDASDLNLNISGVPSPDLPLQSSRAPVNVFGLEVVGPSSSHHASSSYAKPSYPGLSQQETKGSYAVPTTPLSRKTSSSSNARREPMSSHVRQSSSVSFTPIPPSYPQSSSYLPFPPRMGSPAIIPRPSTGQSQQRPGTAGSQQRPATASVYRPSTAGSTRPSEAFSTHVPGGIANPWAPDDGAGLGDFPVRSIAGEEIDLSDNPGGIGRPRVRRVLSRERWREE